MSIADAKKLTRQDWQAAARRALDDIDTRLLVEGNYVDAVDGGRLDSINPATNEIVASVEAGGPPGVFNVINGIGEVAGKALALHNDVNPTLFTGVSSDMRIAQEEIFGPVAAVLPFDGIEEAVRIANDSMYGLSAGVWSSDLNTAHRLIREIEAGVIWINCFDEGDMTQPFGGYKQSGNSRDKCVESLLSYTQSKSAWIRLC